MAPAQKRCYPTSPQTEEEQNMARLGIQIQKPRYHAFSILSSREESFQNEEWPHHHLRPQQMANCGFFYEGPEDNVRCFYCGGAVTKWEPDDDPWVVHARFYPACPHIKLTKGQEFIDSVTRKNNRPEDNQSPTVAKDNNSTAVNLRYALQATKDDLVKIPAARRCIHMDYDRNLVHRAIDKNKKEEMNCDELREENQRLKDILVCKICMDGRATVVFLPCGHMVSCPICAPTMNICPICRSLVTSYVKALLES